MTLEDHPTVERFRSKTKPAASATDAPLDAGCGRSNSFSMQGLMTWDLSRSADPRAIASNLALVLH